MNNKWVTLSLLLIALVVFISTGFIKNNSNQNHQAVSKKEDMIQLPSSLLEVRNNSLNLFFSLNEAGEESDYLHYSIDHIQKSLDPNIAASAYNVWAITSVNHKQPSKYGGFKHVNQIISDGEWFFAAKEKGANDFVGGHHHGDEIFKQVTMSIDGKEIDPSQNNKYENFETLKISFSSELTRDNTYSSSKSKVINRTVEISFTKKGVLSNQSIEFLEAMELSNLYLSMLPINRGSGQNNITSNVSFNNKTFDVTSSGFKYPELTFSNGNLVTIYGDQYKATMEVMELNKEYQSKLLVSNADAYNKLYFSTVNTNTDFNEGDTLNSITEYTFEIK